MTIDRIAEIINVFGLKFEEPELTVFTTFGVLILILVLINYFFKLLNATKNYLSSSTNILILIGVIAFLFLIGINKNNQLIEEKKTTSKLTVLTFKTHKQEYGYNEAIGVQLKFNKGAYFYLFSETKKKMIFPNNYKEGKVHYVEAKQFINLKNAFNVTENMGLKDEKLILLASTQKIAEYDELLGKGEDAYPDVPKKLIEKALEPNESVFITYGESSEAEFAGNDIDVHIKKISIVINPFDSKKLRQIEYQYIDVVSSTNGYVTVFEGTPNKLHRIEDIKVMSDEEVTSDTEVTQPLGEHIAVAIYSLQKENITTNDFNVKAQETKGGIAYSLEFKNEPYPYDIREYNVVQ